MVPVAHQARQSKHLTDAINDTSDTSSRLIERFGDAWTLVHLPITLAVVAHKAVAEVARKGKL